MTIATRYNTGTGTTGAHMFGRARTRKELGDRSVGILYAPGGGGLETSWQSGTSTQPDTINNLLRRLTQDSYSMRFVTMHTDWDWGNDTCSTRMFDALTHAFFSYNFAGSPVHLIGASMGTVCCLNFAKAHPTLVASISLVLPVTNMDDIEDNNRVGAWGLPEPSSAYGGTVPGDHNPIENMSSFTGFPIQMWATTNDSICNFAQAQAFAAGTGATLNSLGTGTSIITGHDASHLPIQDVVDFIIENDTAAESHKAPVIRRHTAGRGQ